MQRWLVTVAHGAAAGLSATAGMTAFMVGMERLGVMPGQPPRKIVDRVAPELTEGLADAAALISHGAYGAAGGAAFALLTADRSHKTAWGIAFGALVWATGYEGWVPALGVLPPAHHDRPSRVGTMVAAHVIYGYLLGRQLRGR